jgi:GMP synthase PP-ATPase subunit
MSGWNNWKQREVDREEKRREEEEKVRSFFDRKEEIERKIVEARERAIEELRRQQDSAREAREQRLK